MAKQQNDHFVELLGHEQKKHDAARKEMQDACIMANRQAAVDKRDKDNFEKNQLAAEAIAEAEFTTTTDFMSENPATEKSMLGDHRVKPYHFKGLTPEQQAAIMNEREMQLNENKMLKASEKEQEKMWAQQQEHMRR